MANENAGETGTTTAGNLVTTRAPDASLAVPSDETGQLVRMQNRLSFYESFDRLIQDNISRSGDLLREAAELREQADIEMAQVRSEADEVRKNAEARLVMERDAQRDVLGSLLNELSTVQQITERLARRVSDALDQVESGIDPPGLPAAASEPAALERLSDPMQFSLPAAYSLGGLNDNDAYSKVSNQPVAASEDQTVISAATASDEGVTEDQSFAESDPGAAVDDTGQPDDMATDTWGDRAFADFDHALAASTDDTDQSDATVPTDDSEATVVEADELAEMPAGPEPVEDGEPASIDTTETADDVEQDGDVDTQGNPPDRDPVAADPEQDIVLGRDDDAKSSSRGGASEHAANAGFLGEGGNSLAGLGEDGDSRAAATDQVAMPDGDSATSVEEPPSDDAIPTFAGDNVTANLAGDESPDVTGDGMPTVEHEIAVEHADMTAMPDAGFPDIEPFAPADWSDESMTSIDFGSFESAGAMANVGAHTDDGETFTPDEMSESMVSMSWVDTPSSESLADYAPLSGSPDAFADLTAAVSGQPAADPSGFDPSTTGSVSAIPAWPAWSEPGMRQAETGVTAPVDSSGASSAGGSRPVLVLVHGVPRAALALSLQRYLANLTDVDGVEAREYTDGVLRLQVTARGALGLEQLRGWESGGELEAMHIADDLIEVKLPGADGF